MVKQVVKLSRNVRNHKIRGLWERNSRYYACLRFPGKKTTSMVPLVDERNAPVETVAQAVLS